MVGEKPIGADYPPPPQKKRRKKPSLLRCSAVPPIFLAQTRLEKKLPALSFSAEKRSIEC